MDNQMFHIYKKNSNEIVQHSLSVDEMENMIAERKVDWKNWDIQPCYTEYTEASY